ncbi:hypothetical protein KY290_008419 [Solanum tuberosum]|uniref:Aldo-keto reductase n=2 Tax=Solanum tuberosum TaxID=4113 RepID=M1ABN1_SOLTU|nr:hypothetical protein KY289_008828 [Solanum tuberosum]KAH0777008.1 hypothetical protein KY290_008419 [Solanum tuberosum]
MGSTAISTQQAFCSLQKFTPLSYASSCRSLRSRRKWAVPARCCSPATDVATAAKENRRELLKNGDDKLEICRVLNGMWQTSGGWGRIDRNDAVEAMLNYADDGLSTFDMADHCMNSIFTSPSF